MKHCSICLSKTFGHFLSYFHNIIKFSSYLWSISISSSKKKIVHFKSIYLQLLSESTLINDLHTADTCKSAKRLLKSGVIVLITERKFIARDIRAVSTFLKYLYNLSIYLSFLYSLRIIRFTFENDEKLKITFTIQLQFSTVSSAWILVLLIIKNCRIKSKASAIQ